MSNRIYVFTLLAIIIAGCSNQKEVRKAAVEYNNLKYCGALAVTKEWGYKDLSIYSITCKHSVHPTQKYLGILTQDTCFVLDQIDSTFSENMYLVKVISTYNNSEEIRKQIDFIINEIKEFNNFNNSIKL